MKQNERSDQLFVERMVWVRHSWGPPFQRAAIPGAAIPGCCDSGVANQMSACGHPRSSSHVDDKKHASKLCDGLPEECSTDLSSLCCA